MKTCLGPYEICFMFAKIQFYCFLNSVFSVLIVLDSVFNFWDSFLMVKLNCMNKYLFIKLKKHV